VVPAQQAGYHLPRIPQFKRNSTRKVVIICPPMVEFGTTLVCNVAIGSQNLYNLTTGCFNTAISQNSSTAITTGDYNMTIGYEAGGGGNGFVTRNNNIANGDSSGNSTNDAAATNNIYIYWPKHWYQLHWCI